MDSHDRGNKEPRNRAPPKPENIDRKPRQTLAANHRPSGIQTVLPQEPNTAPLKPKYIDKETRQKLAARLSSPPPASPNAQIFLQRTPSFASNIPQVELSLSERRLIKERYFGQRSEHKPRRLDRRVNFDWDENDNTLLDHDDNAPAQATMRDHAPRVRHTKSAMAIKSIDQFGNEIEHALSEREPSKVAGYQHWRERSLEAMKDRDWRIMREDFGITVSGGNIPSPLRYWSEAPFPSRLLKIINELDYEEPTPIQRQTIPLILAGRDMIGIAETGSGKTAAFLLPMLCKILKFPPLTDETILNGPYGLVLAPTRELALQIEAEAKKFCRPLGLKTVSIVGGHSLAEQSVQFRRGAEIIIATPGRLRDCLEQHVLVLAQCQLLVLDEADRMIDLNFEQDLWYILDCLPKENASLHSLPREKETPYSFPSPFSSSQHTSAARQTTMFSATMPPVVEKLAKAYLKHPPAIVTVGTAGQAANTVEQRLELLSSDSVKDKRLLQILDDEQFTPPIIIFVNQKRTVDFLSKRLETLGHRTVALHGGKAQEQREVAISYLRNKTRNILIATDVAGRGIDIPDVSLVINYDMPKTMEDYIHRIGRTGRMGKSGVAITLLTNDDAPLFYDLRITVQKAKKSSIPSDFLSHEATRTKPGTVPQKRRKEERIFAYGVNNM